MISKPNLKALYFETSDQLPEHEVLIQLQPPIGKSNSMPKISIICVVDCSGSMGGSREIKANNIIQKIYEAQNVENLEIIKFGSTAQGPFCYSKKENSLPEKVSADLGGTNFIEAMTALLGSLEKKAESDNCLVVFLSDGEAQHPTELYGPVKAQLQRIKAPLLSVAISHNVDPEIMISLANLFGNLGLCLVKDAQTEDEYMDALIRMLPIGSPIDTLSLKIKNAEGSVLNFIEQSYKRQTETITFAVKVNEPVKNLTLEGLSEGIDYSVELVDIKGIPDVEEKLAQINFFVESLCKNAVGQFITKAISREQGLAQVQNLRKFCSAEVDVSLLSASETKEVSPQLRLKKMKDRRTVLTFYNQILQNLNKFEAVFQNTDLKLALEAYSGQVVSSKFNKRLLEIAAKNKEAKEIEISDSDILAYLSSDSRPFPECIYWLQNQFEDAKENPSEIETSEWVGNAVLVSVDRSVSLNPWNLSDVTFRPIKITNSVIELIKDKDLANPKNLAKLKGFEGQFNSSLPLISPDEHAGGVRLILEFMRKNLAAKKTISKLLTNTEELFDPAMINAIYVAGTLNTLLFAKTGIEFELAFKSLLTLADQNLTETPLHKASEGFWEEFLTDLLTSDQKKSEPVEEANLLKEEEKEEDKKPKGNNLVGSKEPRHLPNIIRAFIPLNCTTKAFEVPLEEINNVFVKTFVRQIVDQTSGKYLISELLVLPDDLIKNFAEQLIASNTKKNFEVPEQPFKAITQSVKLYPNKLLAMYYIHTSIRDFLSKNKMNFKDFINGVISGKLKLEIGKEIFVKALDQVNKGLTPFIETVFQTTNPESVLSELIVLACQNHVAEPLPNHDGNDTKVLLNSFDSISELHKKATAFFQKAIKTKINEILSQVEVLMDRKKSALEFIAKVRKANSRYPIQCLRLHFDNLKISYTNHPDIFNTRREMFVELQLLDFVDNDLESLENEPLGFYENFDLNKWRKKHSGFTFGLSLFYLQQLPLSKNKEEYRSKVEECLEQFYSGSHGEEFKRIFSAQMRHFVKISCDHFFDEYHIMKQIKELKIAGESNEDIFEKIINASEEIAALDQQKAQLRKDHIKVLISEIRSDSSII